MSQFNLEVTCQVYKYTREGIIPVSGDNIPKEIQVCIAIIMQRCAAIVQSLSTSTSLSTEIMLDDEDNNHES